MDRTIALVDGWQLAHTAPQACAAPEALIGFPTQWHDAVVPGTVAATLHDDVNVEGDYDAGDWWYRTTFARPEGPPGTRYRLRLELWSNYEFPTLDELVLDIDHGKAVTVAIENQRV